MIDLKSESNFFKRKEAIIGWLPLMFALLYFVFNLFFVQPFGNFPLNDDPLYAIAVRDFMKTGELQIPISMASCFLPEISGAFFCTLFGYSHETLRVHTLIYSLIGILAFFGVLREVGLSRSWSGLFALMYSVNPIYVNLSYSFMTDVYSLTMVNIYCYLLLRGLRISSNACLAGSAIFLGLSFLVRQTNALFIAANFAVLVYLFWRRRSFSLSLVAYLVILPVIIFGAVNYLMSSTLTQASEFSNFYIHELLFRLKSFFTDPKMAISKSWYELAKVILYFGLFLSPALVSVVPKFFKKPKSNLFLLVSLLVSILLSGVVIYRAYVAPHAGTLIPYNANIWWLWTIGPASMLGYSTVPFGEDVRWGVTITAAVLGFLLSLALCSYFYCFIQVAKKASAGKGLSRLPIYMFSFVAFISVLSFLVIQLQVMPMDRYYLQLFLPISLLFAASLKWIRARNYLVLSLVIALAMGAYTSICQSHYMSWNRARWSAINYAHKSGIAPAKIDGGAEYYYLDEIKVVAKVDYKNHQQLSMPEGTRGRPPLDKLRYWAVRGDDYVVSHQVFDGHDVVKSFPYWSNLLGKEKRVYLLKRKDVSEN